MQRFKSSEQAQDFVSAHSFIYAHFLPADIHLQPIPIARSDRMLSDSGTKRPALNTHDDQHSTTLPFASHEPHEVSVRMPLRGCHRRTVHYCKVASKCSAAFRSAISDPSTNCSNIGDRSARAFSSCPCAAHSAAKSIAVRSSHDRAP
jgi:hypothetical protein